MGAALSRKGVITPTTSTDQTPAPSAQAGHPVMRLASKVSSAGTTVYTAIRSAATGINRAMSAAKPAALKTCIYKKKAQLEMAEAINQARPARLHILEKMLEAIEKPRDVLSPHAPRLLSFRIDPELIGTVIGPGGRTIKGITERTNTKIDIEDGGIVTIASHDGAAAEEAQRIIAQLWRIIVTARSRREGIPARGGR